MNSQNNTLTVRLNLQHLCLAPDLLHEEGLLNPGIHQIQLSRSKVVDEVPLALNRKLSLIAELEASVEECKQELHEDLIEYVNFAKSTIDQADSDPTVVSHLESLVDTQDLDQQDLMNRLLTLAQPMLWGVAPVRPLGSSNSPNLPERLRTLLVEISRKINRLQELSRDKLDLAESVYATLDRQLKRLDDDLESYDDLANEVQGHRLGTPDSAPRFNNQPSKHSPAEPARSTPLPNSPTYRSIHPSPESSTPRPRVNLLGQPALHLRSTDSTPTASDSQKATHLHPPESSPLKHSRTLRSTSTTVRNPTILVGSPAVLIDEPHDPRERQQTPQASGMAVDQAVITPSRSPRQKRQQTMTPSTLKRRRTAQDSMENRATENSGDLQSSNEGNLNRGGKLATLDLVHKQHEDDQHLYCYCNRVSFGDMVGCDNPNCQGGEWFHLECAGLDRLPQDDDQAYWYCKSCTETFQARASGSSGPNPMAVGDEPAPRRPSRLNKRRRTEKNKT